MGKHRRRVMRALKINEISGVDVPAQQGALAVIMKRRTGASQTADIDKASALTSPEDGHSHLLVLNGPPDGVELNSGFTEFTEGHQHPWVRMGGGEIVIGTASRPDDGEPHIHRVAFVSKRDKDTEKRTFTAEQRKQLAEEGKALPDGSFPIVTKADLRNAISAFGRASNKAQVARHIRKRARALGALDLLPTEGQLAGLLKSETNDDNVTAGEAGNEGENHMTDDEKKAAADIAKKAADELADVQKQLVKANSIAALNDVEKAHMGTLEGDEARDEFLAKTADERKDIVEKAEAIAKAAAAESDPIEYTTKDGVELRKSVGAGFIAMAKSNDALRDKVEKLTDDKTNAGFEKRAETELAHIPGDLATRVAMLKAIDGIEDEAVREASLNSLRAQDAALSLAFKSAGHSIVPAPGSPDDGLDVLAKKHNEAHPELTPEQAYDAVLKTAEGAELYAKTVN